MTNLIGCDFKHIDLNNFRKLPLFIEGESKEIRKVTDEIGIIYFKPTIYSFTANRCGVVEGSNIPRVHVSKVLCELLKNNGIDHAYIDYTDEQALRITQYVNGEEQEYMLSSTPKHVVANVSQLPDLFLAELYPLSNHQPAYYGKLLGDAYGQLYTVLELAGKDESGERTTYAYQTDKEGRIVGCWQTTVSEGETYTREWKYRVE